MVKQIKKQWQDEEENFQQREKLWMGKVNVVGVLLRRQENDGI